MKNNSIKTHNGKLFKYDEMQHKVIEIASLLTDYNNFVCAKSEELFEGNFDEQWAENQDNINEQLVEYIATIKKLASEDLK